MWNIIQAPAPTEAQAEVENPSNLQCHKLPAARAILSPNFLCLVSDLLQQREVKLHRRHSGSYKQRPARREKRVLNPKCTEISGEMGWKAGKGKMQSEEIMGKEDVDGEPKAELAAWEAV